MSIQSDVELLSVRAIEEYAKRNHISTLSAIEIFHKYQMFEKIMQQHEYLHQVDFAEVMAYVETVIQDDFNQLTVYHGTIAGNGKCFLGRICRIYCRLLYGRNKKQMKHDYFRYDENKKFKPLRIEWYLQGFY